MNAFDAPMPAVDGQYAFRRSFLRRAARDLQCDLTAVRAGLFVDRFALDPEDLPNMQEVEVAIDRRAAPNAPCFDAAMIRRRDLDKIGSAARLEQQGDIAFQRRLVALDREIIVRFPRHYVGGYFVLGQQGVAGDVLAGDVAGFKQRNHHADFVRALVLIAAGDRQCTYFFWA